MPFHEQIPPFHWEQLDKAGTEWAYNIAVPYPVLWS